MNPADAPTWLDALRAYARETAAWQARKDAWEARLQSFETGRAREREQEAMTS